MYATCSCPDLTDFSISSVTSIFVDSNLGKLGSVAALFSFDFLGSPVFYVLILIGFLAILASVWGYREDKKKKKKSFVSGGVKTIG